MPLYVAELDTTADSDISAVIARTAAAASANGGEFIESQV